MKTIKSGGNDTRKLEFCINVLLVVFTFVLGFICQEWVADRAANAYSNLAYTNSILSVSDNIDQIDGVISSVDVSLSQMSKHLRTVTLDSTDYRKNRLAAESWAIIQSSYDSIHNLIPKIIRVSSIVKIPLANNKECTEMRSKINESIQTLRIWAIEDYMRKENIENEGEYKLVAISRYSSTVSKESYLSMYERYIRFKDETPKILKISNVEEVIILKGDSEWFNHTNKECLRALDYLRNVFRAFSNIELMSNDTSLLKRILRYPVATMMVCVLLIAVLLLACYYVSLKKVNH